MPILSNPLEDLLEKLARIIFVPKSRVLFSFSKTINHDVRLQYCWDENPMTFSLTDDTFCSFFRKKWTISHSLDLTVKNILRK